MIIKKRKGVTIRHLPHVKVHVTCDGRYIRNSKVFLFNFYKHRTQQCVLLGKVCTVLKEKHNVNPGKVITWHSKCVSHKTRQAVRKDTPLYTPVHTST